MKKSILYSIVACVLFFAIASFKVVGPTKIYTACKVLKSPATTTKTNVTLGVTTTFQYFSSGGLYTGPISSIGGNAVALSGYSHTYDAASSLYFDKFHGTVPVSGEFVDIEITGKPNVAWDFRTVTVIP
jgi:hypothetical protein